MKILRIASRASFLAILSALFLGTPAAADPAVEVPGAVPTSPEAANQAETDAIPAPPSAQLPASQSTLGPSTPDTVPTPWLDKILNQRLPITFGLLVSEAHSDNIFYYFKKTEDYITAISPSLAVTLGKPVQLAPKLQQETADDETDAGNLNYVQLTYQPTLNLYAKNSFLDNVDESADGIISHQFSRLTLSLEQNYQKLSAPTVQINTPGALNNRDLYTTTAKANYIYSDALSTYGTLGQSWNHFIGTEYNDYTEWTADYYFLYQLFPKLSVGFGPRVGWDDIDQSANESFQTGLVHFNYAATSKFGVIGAAGVELREFQGDVVADKISPIVEGTAIYRPFDSMTITLNGDRHHISSSGSTGGDYDASIGTLEFKQRFFQVVYATVEAQYEQDQYEADGGATLARDDNIYFLTAGLEWKSFRGLTVDAGYSYLRDESNLDNYSFTENRVTISASFKY